MMNEIPTKTRTGERTEPFLMLGQILMLGQKKSKVDSGSGNLPSLRRPERTNQSPEPVRRVSLLAFSRCVAVRNSAARPRI